MRRLSLLGIFQLKPGKDCVIVTVIERRKDCRDYGKYWFEEIN